MHLFLLIRKPGFREVKKLAQGQKTQKARFLVELTQNAGLANTRITAMHFLYVNGKLKPHTHKLDLLFLSYYL